MILDGSVIPKFCFTSYEFHFWYGQLSLAHRLTSVVSPDIKSQYK